MIARVTKTAAPAAMTQAPRVEYQLSALKNETVDSKAKAMPPKALAQRFACWCATTFPHSHACESTYE